jgi:hypothetical protein
MTPSVCVWCVCVSVSVYVCVWDCVCARVCMRMSEDHAHKVWVSGLKHSRCRMSECVYGVGAYVLTSVTYIQHAHAHSCSQMGVDGEPHCAVTHQWHAGARGVYYQVAGSSVSRDGWSYVSCLPVVTTTTKARLFFLNKGMVWMYLFHSWVWYSLQRYPMMAYVK